MKDREDLTWLLPCCGMPPVMASYCRRIWLYKTQDKIITFIFIAVVSHVAGNFLGTVPPSHSAPGSSHIVGEKDGVSSETGVLHVLHLSPHPFPALLCALCLLCPLLTVTPGSLFLWLPMGLNQWEALARHSRSTCFPHCLPPHPHCFAPYWTALPTTVTAFAALASVGKPFCHG